MSTIDVRLSIYSPIGALLFQDVSGDLGGGQITYEDTPGGCGAANIPLGLRAEEIKNRGYWVWPNICEISTGDNTLKTAAAAGANKYYLIEGTANFDPSLGEDAQLAYFYDGATLTMRVPVTGVGNDSGGAYITTSAPLGGGAVPAYTAQTVVGRRRYAGRIGPRDLPFNRLPTGCSITCVGLSIAFAQASGSFTINAAANVDVGQAIYQSLAQFATRWPFLTISASNFPNVGSTYHGTLTDVMCDRLVSDALMAITSGDYWTVRVGHDRTPRLIKLFAQASNTYTYAVSLIEGSFEYEPTSIELTDQDPSGVFNQVQIVGDTDPTTQQPVRAIVQDPNAVAAAGGLVIDGAAVNNQAIKDVTGASQYGLSQLAQHSLPISSNKLVVFTRNDFVQGTTPNGAANGDVVRAVASIVLQGSNQTGIVANYTGDSGFLFASSATSSTWKLGTGFTVVAGTPENTLQSTTGGSAYSEPIVVQPGQTFSLSVTIDARQASGSAAPDIQLVSLSAAGNPVFAIIRLNATNGQISNLSGSMVIPPGTTLVAVYASMETSTGLTIYSKPMLNTGAIAKPYVPNLGQPIVYGLPSSVVTQIDLDNLDTQQKVSFAAIDPDWNSALLEVANAAATQLRSNTNALLNAIDQYCVSTDVRGFTTTTTSLSVAWPTFLAIFGAGSNILTLGNNSTLLTASATNFVWINANGSYTVNLTASPVQGAILLGIFQTSSSGVIGSTLKASIGVIKVGVGNINVATSLPIPTFAAQPSVTNGNSLNGIAADVIASASLNNVPSSAIGLLWVYRQAVAAGGSGTWLPYGTTNLTAASGSVYPAASQTASFEYGDLTNGTSYDFGVAYESLGGFGTPPATIATSFAARAISIPTSYFLQTTFLPTITNASLSAAPSTSGVSATAAVSFTITNQPTDGSLARIGFWFKTSGSTVWTPWTTLPAIAGTSASYSIRFTDLTNGIGYDFGASGVNAAGGEGAVALIGSITAQTIAITVPYLVAGASPTPTIQSSPGPVLYSAPALTGLAYRFGVTFTVTNQPQDGSLSRLTAYLRVTGTNWSAQFSIQAYGLPNPPAAQQYYFEFADVTAGVAYDIGVSYENAQGGDSAIATIVSNVMPAAIGVATQYMLGGISITPTFSGTPTPTTTVSGNGVSASTNLTFTITNQPTDGSLSRISFWVRATPVSSSVANANTIGQTGFAWSPYGGAPATGTLTTPPTQPASGTYANFNVADLTNSVAYDFGCSFENAQGGESTIGVIYSNYTAGVLNLSANANAAIPPAIAASPGITGTSLGAQQSQGAAGVTQPFTFATSDFTSPVPGWFAGYIFFIAQHPYSSNQITRAGSLGITSTVSGISGSVILAAGGTYDIGIAYEGANSTTSAVVWPSAFQNVVVAPINPVMSVAGAGTGNLVPDGQLAHIISSGNEGYWFGYLIDGISFKVVQGNQYQPFGLFSWTNGVNNSSDHYANSQPFQLIAGQTYTASCYLDLINASGNAGAYIVGPITGSVSNVNPTVAPKFGKTVATMTKAGGFSGNATATFTPSTTGQYVFQFASYGATVGGSPIFMACAMVQPGSTFTGFLPSTPVQTDTTATASVGTTAHVVASPQVQSTIAVTSDAVGSYVQPGVVNAGKLAGGLAADTGNLLDTSSSLAARPLLLARHQPVVALDSTGTQANIVQDSDYQFSTSYWSANNGASISSTFGVVASGVCGYAIIATTSGSGGQILNTLGWPVLPNTTYTISWYYADIGTSGWSGNAALYGYDGGSYGSGSNVIAYGLANGTNGRLSLTFTTSSTATSLVVSFQNNGSTWSGSGSRNISQVQVEQGSLATSYKRGGLAQGSSGALAYGAHFATVKNTIANAPSGIDGSPLLPGLVTARHLIGGTASDGGSLLDGTGVGASLVIARHAKVVQLDTTGSQVNVVPDSDIRYGLGPNAYWNATPTNFTTGALGSKNFFGYITPSGGSSQVNYPLSNLTNATVPVTPGYAYTVSAQFDTGQMASCTSALIVINANTGTEIPGSRTTVSQGLSFNIAARNATTFTIPSGCGGVYFVWQVTGSSGDAGRAIYLGQIQLEIGSIATGYKANESNHASTSLVHNAMSPGIRALSDPTGQIINAQVKSTFLNTQASALPIGTPTLTLTGYTDNNNNPGIRIASSTAVYYPSSATPTAATAFSQSFDSTSTNGSLTLAFATSYYFVFSYRATTNALVLVSGPTTSPASLATIASIYADGAVPVSGAASVKTVASAGASGTTGTGGGGFGGRQVSNSG